jgi:isobutylamine N-monooxygenase
VRSLFARYTVQEALMRMSGRAAEMLGGIAFVTSERIGYLIAAVRCLAFHPPSKAAVRSSLDTFLSGEPFMFV